jgi:AraC family transcriptional regulator
MEGTSALAIEGCIFEILAEASRSKVHAAERKSPRWLERVKEFLHGNFSEPFIYEDVAKVAGVHPVHLARVFREQNSCTIGEYVRRLRVDFALRQLSETENPLSEIAAAAGFADHSHFTRTFKAYIGLTPSEYRKNPR